MSPKLVGAQAKLQRAREHVDHLVRAVMDFWASRPCEIRTKVDPDTRRLIYYVARVDPVPAPVQLIAGEALQATRSALDHLAYQLCQSSPGCDPGHVQFPVADTAAKFNDALKKSAKGMRQDALDLFDAIEPFAGGKGQRLWVLHRLNNIDKHRDLLAISGSFQSLDFGEYMHRQMETMFGPEVMPPDMPRISMLLRPADPLCPLKVGDELFIDAVDAKPNDRMQFQIGVSFAVPQIVMAEPVDQTLRQLTDAVEDVLRQFDPLLP